MPQLLTLGVGRGALDRSQRGRRSRRDGSMRRGGELWLGLGVAAMALLSSSCDSRWFDMQRAQEAAVERLRPGELQGGEGSADHRLVRRLEVRVYVSPRYSTELVGWRDQLDTMIDDANKV